MGKGGCFLKSVRANASRRNGVPEVRPRFIPPAKWRRGDNHEPGDALEDQGSVDQQNRRASHLPMAAGPGPGAGSALSGRHANHKDAGRRRKRPAGEGGPWGVAVFRRRARVRSVEIHAVEAVTGAQVTGAGGAGDGRDPKCIGSGDEGAGGHAEGVGDVVSAVAADGERAGAWLG